MIEKIKFMHLNEGALLKNEMKEKLDLLNQLAPTLTQPKSLIAKNLGLMSAEDV